MTGEDSPWMMMLCLLASILFHLSGYLPHLGSSAVSAASIVYADHQGAVVAGTSSLLRPSTSLGQSGQERTAAHTHKITENIGQNVLSTKSEEETLNDTIVNPHNFNFTINEETLCQENVFLIIVVCSAVHRVEQRQAIRDTWGDIVSNAEASTKVIFMVGAPGDPVNMTLQEALQSESDRYHDIIQEDFVDTYKNLSLKSVAVLRWLDAFCQSVQFFLKTDDDMFVNVPLLLHDLHNTVHHRFIMGAIIAGASPVHDRNSKWYTPQNVFREARYPKYVSGTAYVISRDLVHDLYNAALRTKLFWLEDIYITGLVAQKTDAKHIYNGKFGFKRRLMNPCLFRIVITGHRVGPTDLRKMWTELQREDLKCSYTRIHLNTLS